MNPPSTNTSLAALYSDMKKFDTRIEEIRWKAFVLHKYLVKYVLMDDPLAGLFRDLRTNENGASPNKDRIESYRKQWDTLYLLYQVERTSFKKIEMSAEAYHAQGGAADEEFERYILPYLATLRSNLADLAEGMKQIHSMLVRTGML